MNNSVQVKKIKKESLDKIKTDSGISDNSPIIALVIDKQGGITVITGEGEFTASLPKHPIREITSVTPACVIVASGSTVTNVNIGGTSITHEWGP